MNLTLVAMAAGMGSRFGGPKQLEPLGPQGETMIDYAIYDAIRAGFSRTVLIIRREMEDAFRSGVVARWEGVHPVEYVFQEMSNLPAGYAVPEGRKKPWGTGHAVLAVAEAVQGPFGVINADDFYGPSAYGVLGDFLKRLSDPQEALYVNVGFSLKDTMTDAGDVNRGVMYADEDGWLYDIEEVIGIVKQGEDGRVLASEGAPRVIPGDTQVSMNMWGFTPALFGQLQTGLLEFLEKHAASEKAEYLLPTYVQDLVAQGKARVKIVHGEGPWCGITYPEDKPRVMATLNGLIMAGEYPEVLWQP